MNMVEIRKMAKKVGVNAGRKKKLTLIREIQKKEGNFACFGTAQKSCDQLGCLWRLDCLK